MIPFDEHLFYTWIAMKYNIPIEFANPRSQSSIITQNIINKPFQNYPGQSINKNNDFSTLLTGNRTDEDPGLGCRVPGKIYIVKGVRKRWDGTRFARVCTFGNCMKLSQGKSQLCKFHSSGRRCRYSGCNRLVRKGRLTCNVHDHASKQRKSNQ